MLNHHFKSPIITFFPSVSSILKKRTQKFQQEFGVAFVYNTRLHKPKVPTIINSIRI